MTNRLLTSLPDFLASHLACREALAWASGRAVDEAAYLACPRGDWLLWLLARLGLARPRLVLAACACARDVLHLAPAGEERPRLAIEAAEGWARGGEGSPTLAEVRAAYAAAYAAAANAAMRQRTADIVRSHVPWADVAALLSSEDMS